MLDTVFFPHICFLCPETQSKNNHRSRRYPKCLENIPDTLSSRAVCCTTNSLLSKVVNRLRLRYLNHRFPTPPIYRWYFEGYVYCRASAASVWPLHFFCGVLFTTIRMKLNSVEGSTNRCDTDKTKRQKKSFRFVDCDYYFSDKIAPNNRVNQFQFRNPTI